MICDNEVSCRLDVSQCVHGRGSENRKRIWNGVYTEPMRDRVIRFSMGPATPCFCPGGKFHLLFPIFASIPDESRT